MLEQGISLSAKNIVALTTNLFQELKVEGISDSEDTESDMLLFQYGIYDWGNEWGEHFSFDITRQLYDFEEGEPYQLNVTLVYEPKIFEGLEKYSCWSSDYTNIEDFTVHILTTDGFKLVEKTMARTYHIEFSQC